MKSKVKDRWVRKKWILIWVLILTTIYIAPVLITGYFQDRFKQDEIILEQKEKLQVSPTFGF